MRSNCEASNADIAYRTKWKKFSHLIFGTVLGQIGFLLKYSAFHSFAEIPVLGFSGPRIFWSVVTQGMFVKRSMYNRILIDYTTNCKSTNVETKIN